jgi:CheY-like chemotaxis protein
MTPRFQPDLVLSDMAMPDKDGIELLREIGSLGPSEGGKVAVIAITGLS